ncbi:MAG: DUF1080 domain-containing protein [Acidobacteriota bacterium]|nr:DUF1080 domain-containing protein [Acidobacteriota bacterium]
MRLHVFALLASISVFAADRDFNGRWDITVPHESKNRAWWLEVTGAGTPAIAGRFVGFPGGNMDQIPNISIRDGELHFSTDRNQKQKTMHLEYTAKLSGGKLEGAMHSGDETLTWTGVRAPEIPDQDDGSWHEGNPIEMFNHKDLAGWHGVVKGQALGWTVQDGILSSSGGANNLECDRKFWNFKLHVEFRVGPHSNSGIGLRGRYEVQILEDYGEPPNLHGNGALYSRIKPPVNASKKSGEWQSMDIRLVGRIVSVVLNDQKLIDKQTIEGLTAIATDPNESEPGPLVLQGDHGPVDFRVVVLTPLTK